MNWYKQSKFQLSVLGADSYGYLTLNINGEIKKYQLPHTAVECPSDIAKLIKRKMFGKLAEYIKWLEQFVIGEKKDMDVGVGSVISKDECIPVVPAGT